MTETTWLQFIQGAAAILTIIMAFVLAPMARLVWKIRTNDLEHLDQKVDTHHLLITSKLDAHHRNIDDKFAVLSDRIEEVSRKLEKHLDWHFTQRS